MIVVLGIREAFISSRNDNRGIVTNVQIGQVGQHCPNYANVDAVMAKDQFTQADEG